MDPLIVAALITASGAILAAVVTVVGSSIKARENKFFSARSNSDETWFRDMLKAESLIFLGTSHTHLYSFLTQLLNRVQGGSKLRNIEIYYASDENGKAHENENFLPSVRQSRQKIAALVCQPEWKIKFPYFDSVLFRQTTQAITFSGSIIKKKTGKAMPIIYVVHHPYKGLFDADEMLTFRYTSTLPAIFSRQQAVLVNVYLSSYEKVSNNALCLGDFRRSLWDMSIKQWADFSQTCSAHRESMRTIVEFADIKKADSVLDLACGTGHVSKIIKDMHPSIKLTLLDASPQMINTAKMVLGDQAEYALCKIPSDNKQCEIGLLKDFDVIIIHLSLPAAAETNHELDSLVDWCKHHVADNGKIVIAAHNTAVDIKSSYSKDNDPLRRAIKEQMNTMGLSDMYRKLDKPSFKPEQIEQSFIGRGFVCSEKQQRSYKMEMIHRVLMWRAPVVINDLVDIEKVGDDKIERLIRNVELVVSDQDTPDMDVMFWRFDNMRIGNNAAKGA